MCAIEMPDTHKTRDMKNLPELLTCQDGVPVCSAADWMERRRPELVALLAEHEYGVPPEALREGTVSFEAEPEMPLTEQGLRMTLWHCRIAVQGETFEFPFACYRAEDALAMKQPVVLAISAFGDAFWDAELRKGGAFFPARRIVERGYAAIQVKADAWVDERMRALFPARDFGDLAAWAFAAQRVLDWAEQRPELDAGRVSISGCSRAGKAALWAAASDPRFAAVMTNVSGCGGAAVTRGKSGERVAQITGGFPDWFCARYGQYAGREEEMPFDQHFLLAAIAPRPLCIGSAEQDEWADPQAEYAACVLADQAYRVLGLTGLGGAASPTVDVPIVAGRLWYHMRSGTHGLEEFDWTQYLAFCDAFLRG